MGSRIEKLSTLERLESLQKLICPNHPEQQDYINLPSDKKKHQKDWKNDILPRGIKQYPNYMVMGDTYVTVLFGHRYRQAIDTDKFIHSMSNVSYPSFLTLDYAPVETDLVNDKLINAQVNNERAITEEIEQKRNAGIPVG